MKAMDPSSQQAGRQAMQWAELLAQHTEAAGMLPEAPRDSSSTTPA